MLRTHTAARSHPGIYLSILALAVFSLGFLIPKASAVVDTNACAAPGEYNRVGYTRTGKNMTLTRVETIFDLEGKTGNFLTHEFNVGSQNVREFRWPTCRALFNPFDYEGEHVFALFTGTSEFGPDPYRIVFKSIRSNDLKTSTFQFLPTG
jgi:hypothetical protein